MADASAARWHELKYVIVYLVTMSFMAVIIANSTMKPIGLIAEQVDIVTHQIPITDVIGIANKLLVMSTISSGYAAISFIITPMTLAFAIILLKWIRDILPL
jgi:hypothetical protein